MKMFVRSILFTSVIAMGANGLIAGSASDRWIDQWYRAKFGRSSPMEEARQKAEQKNTAFREESTPEVGQPANTLSTNGKKRSAAVAQRRKRPVEGR